jgi:polyhydroxyalkanoate synthesis regulator phasin
MSKTQIATFDNCEMQKDVTFEVSKEITIVTKIAYRKEDAIALLTSEIQELKRQIADLKTTNVLATKESLVKLWDNKHDNQWNNC